MVTLLIIALRSALFTPALSIMMGRLPTKPQQVPTSGKKKEHDLGGFNQAGFKGAFLQKHLNPIRGPFLGDSVQILGVCPAVTLILVP